MEYTRMRSRRSKTPHLVIVALLLIGSIGVMITTASDINLGAAGPVSGLTEDESTYYAYVAPRLDRLVAEVDDVVTMVEGKSRDIVALTVGGNRIETLSREIAIFGEEHGVPERFRPVHASIISATNTTSHTFGQARKALRTFDFSVMSGLVTELKTAADELHDAQGELQAIARGTKDAIAPRSPSAKSRLEGFTLRESEQENHNEV